jgi:hypothetical protein
MVETYDATRPRPVEAEIQSRIWTAIIITSLAAGITGAVIRHIFDDDRVTTPAGTVDTTPGIRGTTPGTTPGTDLPPPPPGER